MDSSSSTPGRSGSSSTSSPFNPRQVDVESIPHGIDMYDTTSDSEEDEEDWTGLVNDEKSLFPKNSHSQPLQ